MDLVTDLLLVTVAEIDGDAVIEYELVNDLDAVRVQLFDVDSDLDTLIDEVMDFDAESDRVLVRVTLLVLLVLVDDVNDTVGDTVANVARPPCASIKRISQSPHVLMLTSQADSWTRSHTDCARPEHAARS